MSFNVNCPHCNNLVDVEEEWFGMSVECPWCEKVFIFNEQLQENSKNLNGRRNKIAIIVSVAFLIAIVCGYGSICYIRKYCHEKGFVIAMQESKYSDENKKLEKIREGIKYVKIANSLGYPKSKEMLEALWNMHNSTMKILKLKREGRYTDYNYY